MRSSLKYHENYHFTLQIPSHFIAYSYIWLAPQYSVAFSHWPEASKAI